MCTALGKTRDPTATSRAAMAAATQRPWSARQTFEPVLEFLARVSIQRTVFALGQKSSPETKNRQRPALSAFVCPAKAGARVDLSGDRGRLLPRGLKQVGSLKTVDASEAQASFFALIAAAEQGRPTTITRRGVSVAVIAPIGRARKIYPGEMPSFVDFLLSFPAGMEFERDSGAICDVDL